MLKWIVNQDRDSIVKLEDVSNLRNKTVYFKDKIIGFNLVYAGELLGTFDTVVECLSEMSYIINTKEEIYIINGYNL